MQETYFRLAANNAKALRDFEPRYPGSSFCYLAVIAVRVTHDSCKRKDFQRTEELPPDLPAAAPANEDWLALKAAIDGLLRKRATPRDRQIFWLHHLHGLTAREIAGIRHFDLSVKGVESLLFRLRRLIEENFGGGEREQPA
ncbi:MAG: sigma-70 family RNA polymerase sigma factor [Bryobacteraceae bacterium]